MFYSARTGKVEVLCGQGCTPAGATLERYRAEGLSLIPGNGLLATVIPGAFDAWMLLLRDHGTMRLRDVLEPAIYYAEHGHALMPRISNTIAGLKDFFQTHWPSTAEIYLPGGAVPEARKLFRNPALARTWTRLLTEAESAGADRERQIEAARDVFYRGFVAEAIDAFARGTEVMDESGARHRGVLTADDLAGWSASYDAPATYDYHGYTVARPAPGARGRCFCRRWRCSGHGPDRRRSGQRRVHPPRHRGDEAGLADREAYYGDPAFVDVPLERLLSEDYNAARRRLIGEQASHELSPGRLAGFEAQVDRVMDTLRRLSKVTEPGAAPAVVAPAGAAASARRDTTHVDVIDRWGNMISATPSGGWFQSSPVIPALGFGLNTRAQMFWLEEGLPGTLAPGKRPRTTLTPTLALRDGAPYMAFGTPGGDQQEQWQLLFFLRHVHHGLNLQESIDLPMSHTSHFPSSFYPRDRKPGHLAVEASIGAAVIEQLRQRGHVVEEAAEWSVGRLTAASRDPDGLLHAAATPRLMQAYAIGR